MNLKQLEAFVKVADEGSFSKAAKGLFLTQPTVSAHISSLEKELDARLFVRNTKEVSLSEDGRMLYGYAKEMIVLEKKIEEQFHKGKEPEERCITIAASTIPAQYLLPGILSRFSEKYPKEQFRIMETDSTKVIEQVVAHAVDIGFTGTVLEKKHCRYIPFYRDELVVITPNTARFQKIDMEKDGLFWMEKEPVILREEGSGTRKEAVRQLKALGIRMEALNVVASIANQETIKRSVENGMGISIVSKLAAADETKAGRILSFPLGEGSEGRDLNLVYNKNFQLTRSAERFIRVVKEMYVRRGLTSVSAGGK